ncbi:M23 family metallopeptidase [Amnibacterium flavum]|uniref:M23 family peptidase n=1 Tax=Amnibacterium flavum TaxID=2173173 RepID=A0A2V1HXP4_9MICO|nr:M23 family metallopeptidase [Amnibacterium flavum]PVZ96129.1 M23 family peptidase [Amnibacterium flavum]
MASTSRPCPRPIGGVRSSIGRRIARAASIGVLLGLALPLAPTPAEARVTAPAAESMWAWPIVPPRIVTRGYEAPATRYAPGHRGIDLEAPSGTPVTAPDSGVVAFAGWVVDRPVVSIRHVGGIVSSFEPVEPGVHVGQVVRRGDVIGQVATSEHCDGCIHLGARLNGEYLSPLALLGGVPRAVLLPLED